jgi:uncharacterized protein (DUF433 family)
MTQGQRERLKTVVTINSRIMGGTPCFAGTRVPIQALIDHLEGGSTLDDFLIGFPAVSREQAIRFIEMAKDHLLECASSLMNA